MYVYLRFYGASTSQVIGARNEWWLMMIMARWYSGTLGPNASRDFSYRWGKNPEKNSPKKLVPTGDRARARCVIGAHATDCPTAMDSCVESATRGVYMTLINGDIHSRPKLVNISTLVRGVHTGRLNNVCSNFIQYDGTQYGWMSLFIWRFYCNVMAYFIM